MSKIRVMFVGAGPSALPKDRVVNVFHFSSVDPYAVGVELALDAVEEFYQAPNATHALAGWLSPWVQRATAELRAYDLEQAPPRIPLIRPFTLGASNSTQGLPEEVAVVLTLEGPPPITRRRRGRLYFGPMITGCIDMSSSTDPARPTTPFTNDLRFAAGRLLANNAPNLQWSIRSMVPAVNYVPINGGYVDDALDTQRRRGPDPTGRTAWSVG